MDPLWIVAAFVFGVGASRIGLPPLVGYLLAAPVMILILMLMIGERRPLWLVTGILIIPLAVWGTIELLLKRPLP